MWWRKLWCPITCWGLFSLDCLLSGPFNKWEHDRWARRAFTSHDRSMIYLRDIHITGSEYVMSGLDSISETD
ncbi:hypothetical protein ACQ4LE_003771 [Meloidogyne hapla]